MSEVFMDDKLVSKVNFEIMDNTYNRKDFSTEQSYYIGMRKMHNRLLYGVGIAYGFDFEFLSNSEVLIKKGVALDKKGRELISKTDFKKTLFDDSDRNNADKRFVIMIYFAEETVRPRDAGEPGNMAEKELRSVEKIETVTLQCLNNATWEVDMNLVSSELGGKVSEGVALFGFDTKFNPNNLLVEIIQPPDISMRHNVSLKLFESLLENRLANIKDRLSALESLENRTGLLENRTGLLENRVGFLERKKLGTTAFTPVIGTPLSPDEYLASDDDNNPAKHIISVPGLPAEGRIIGVWYEPIHNIEDLIRFTRIHVYPASEKNIALEIAKKRVTARVRIRISVLYEI